MDDLSDAQFTVMRRAGATLAVIGLLDIASCVVSIAHGASYSSSLNVFALVAGVLVYRGSGSAARLVVKGLSFLLGGFLLLPLVTPAITPTRLAWLLLKRSPWHAAAGLTVYVSLLAVMYWIRQTLGELPIHGGQMKAPPLHRSLPAGLGAAIPLLLAVILPVSMAGPAGRRAVAEAARKVGPGYSFHVQQMSTSINTSGTRGRATVVAYSDAEIRYVAVEWAHE